MYTIKKQGLKMVRIFALFSILALWITPAYASNKCRMHLTFENNHSTRIKVERITIGGSRFERFSNIVIPAGERGSTKRRHNLHSFNLLNEGLSLKNGETSATLRVDYKIWEPQNNRWVDSGAGFFTRTCRDKKNMFFKLPIQ